MSDQSACSNSPGAPPALTPHQVRELAVLARVHPNTVVRFLRGAAIRSTVCARIVDALRQCSNEFASLLPRNP